MFDAISQFFDRLFCNHEFKKLKDDSYICRRCSKTKEKTIPNIRRTNSYNSNMEIIERRIQREKEKAKSQ